MRSSEVEDGRRMRWDITNMAMYLLTFASNSENCRALTHSSLSTSSFTNLDFLFSFGNSASHRFLFTSLWMTRKGTLVRSQRQIIHKGRACEERENEGERKVNIVINRQKSVRVCVGKREFFGM